jgi:hypothetical protein
MHRRSVVSKTVFAIILSTLVFPVPLGRNILKMYESYHISHHGIIYAVQNLATKEYYYDLHGFYRHMLSQLKNKISMATTIFNIDKYVKNAVGIDCVSWGAFMIVQFDLARCE